MTGVGTWLITTVFNTLPVGSLDGGRMVQVRWGGKEGGREGRV